MSKNKLDFCANILHPFCFWSLCLWNHESKKFAGFPCLVIFFLFRCSFCVFLVMHRVILIFCYWKTAGNALQNTLMFLLGCFILGFSHSQPFHICHAWKKCDLLTPETVCLVRTMNDYCYHSEIYLIFWELALQKHPLLSGKHP